ncbi:MAG: ATP synthase F0 subunit B [Candidatus Schekmanbacteria bacterium]|nr:ATP synthase F0 subunit B [Candidatus Schekmanbacteria bacterium]
MLKIDFTLFILAINFVILMIILNKKLFLPLVRIMDERDSDIKGAFSKAAKFNDEAAGKNESFANSVAAEKRNSIQQQGENRKLASVSATEIVKAAQKEAEDKLSSVRDNLRQEKERASRDLALQTEALAKDIADKILKS